MSLNRYAVRRDHRFWSVIEPIPECGCWLMPTSIVGDGYAKFMRKRAHRWAYERFVGPIPSGFVVCHRCDVPSCVNPAHLFLATQPANIADKVAKGRQARGERQGSAKLTEAQIPLIRTARGTLTSIAAAFGVDRAVIRRIKNRELWKHVP